MAGPHQLTAEERDKQSLDMAIFLLKENIDSDPMIRGGELVIKGTRFPVSQIFGELTEEDTSIKEFCEDYRLPRHKVVGILEGFAHLLRTKRSELWTLINKK